MHALRAKQVNSLVAITCRRRAAQDALIVDLRSESNLTTMEYMCFR